MPRSFALMMLCYIVVFALGNAVDALDGVSTTQTSIQSGKDSLGRDLLLNGVDIPRPTTLPFDNKDGVSGGVADGDSNISNNSREEMDDESGSNNSKGLIYSIATLMALICFVPWIQKSCCRGYQATSRDAPRFNETQQTNDHQTVSGAVTNTVSQSNILTSTATMDDQLSQREQQLEARRRERREFYLSYIEPYTMVVNDKDFVIQPAFKRSTTKQDVVSPVGRSGSQEEDGRVDEDAGDIEMGTITASSLATKATKASCLASAGTKKKRYPVQPHAAESVGDYICQEIASGKDDEAISVDKKTDNDGNISGSNSNNDSGSDDDVDDAELEELDDIPAVYLQLPDAKIKAAVNLKSDNSNINDDTDTEKLLHAHQKRSTRCVVDNNCAICLEEYEVGNKVVWSALEECNHAFHQECILQWLSKGKKRCPICRQWFVPGLSIAEQIEAREQEQRELVASVDATPPAVIQT